jgi:hypothetical protein
MLAKKNRSDRKILKATQLAPLRHWTVDSNQKEAFFKKKGGKVVL